jgi:hypothetical protein
MRRVVRFIHGPVVVASLAAAMAGATLIGSGATAALAGPVPATATSRTIVGKWNVSGGDFRFYKTRAKNTYTDQVIKQRPNVFCPKINDQNKQIYLHQSAKNPRVYTGRWKWFYTASCAFAGWGPVTVTLWRTYNKATFVSDPPKGLSGSPETFIIKRIA